MTGSRGSRIGRIGHSNSMSAGDPTRNLIGQAMVIGGETYYLGEHFARSNFSIHLVCTDRDLSERAGLVAKVFRIAGYVGEEDVDREFRYSSIAHAIGVSPRAVDKIPLAPLHTTADRFCTIVFERFGEGSLTDLVHSGRYANHRWSVNLQLRHILDALYDAGIYHNDTHSDNFLYGIADGGGGDVEMKVIDFGASRDMTPETQRRYCIEVLSPAGSAFAEIDLSGGEVARA